MAITSTSVPWTGSAGGTYYQIDVSNTEYATKTYDYASGFYWAGAVKVGNYIYFGSDNGVLHYRSIADFKILVAR